MEKRFLWVGLASLAIVILGAAIVLVTQQPANTFNGSVIDPPAPAPEIALTDQHGQPFLLSDLKGQVVLLYFGFTNCPDFCPNTLAVLRQVLDQLGDQADAVQVVLVTTDPARDTQERLSDYLAAFNPTFLGLTGSDADLQVAYQGYGVTVMDEGTTHSTRVHLIDPQGMTRLTFSYGMPAGDILHDVRLILQEE
jgi:protein SCO1/2